MQLQEVQGAGVCCLLHASGAQVPGRHLLLLLAVQHQLLLPCCALGLVFDCQIGGSLRV